MTPKTTPVQTPRRTWRRTLGLWLKDCLLLWPAFLILGAGLVKTQETGRPIGTRIRMALDPGVGESLSPYGPTPMPAVEGALNGLQIGPGSVLVDIGSGDGRVVVAAAERGARAIGIDRKIEMVERGREAAGEAGVTENATFIHGDALDYPEVVGQADTVYLYLMPEGLDILSAWLEAGVLRNGTTVVASMWPVPQWRPERVRMLRNVREDNDPWGFPIHYYRIGDHEMAQPPPALR
ncbi:MAG: class I SAM-dependent methyltransferase [Acidobacteria bacterium]|nr:class I SAM-dependent methyltransferase [Acidobacteriota bacterium]